MSIFTGNISTQLISLMCMQKHCLFIFCLFTMLFGCKRKDKEPAPTCPTSLFGYAANFDTTYWVGRDKVAFPAVIINASDGTNKTLGYIEASESANTGVWNSTDKCYYLFRQNEPVLYKIALDGSVTEIAYSLPNANVGIEDVHPVYDRITRKIYCLSYKTLMEVRISDGKFSFVPVGSAFAGYPCGLTINHKTGDLYYCIDDSLQTNPFYRHVHIDRYNTSTSTLQTVFSEEQLAVSAPPFLGLQFNPFDNMIYGFKTRGTIHYNFVKINPLSGVVDSLSDVCNIRQYTSPTHYSSAFDSCSNTYIVSYFIGDKQYYFEQLNTSGQFVGQYKTPSIYLGLTTKR